MNGTNHQMNAVSTFPFYTFEGWEQTSPTQNDLPIKGDTIIDTNSVIGSDVDPYTIVVGNPARTIRKRFDEEIITSSN